MIGGDRGTFKRLVVVFAVLIVSTATVIGTVTVSASDVDGVAVVDATTIIPEQREPSSQNSTTTGANHSSATDTTIIHRKPSEVRSDANLSNVQVWLARELTDHLSQSLRFSQEDSKRAQKLIDNNSKYAELADQYTEVNGRLSDAKSKRGEYRSNEVSDGPANGTVSSVSPVVVGIIQREFIANAQRYRQTYRAYQRARDRNATLRVRHLAHELERHLRSINRTATLLNRSYADLSASQQTNLQNATRTIGNIRTNITQTQMTVRNQTLIRTRLSVRTLVGNGSFTAPATITGRLQTADGTPVDNETVTLEIGNSTVNSTTDRRGRFQIRYRPTLTAAGSRRLTVEFRPKNESVYLWENETVHLRIQQVTPTVRIKNLTEVTRYDEQFVVNGTVSAGGVAIPNVPLVVTVGDIRLGRVRTDPNGSFGVTGRLPANLSTGTHRIRVQLALDNATRIAGGPVALAPANATTTVRVESQPTALSIVHLEIADGTALISGQLTTASGKPLPNRTVTVFFNGTSVGIATTNATGGYTVTTSVPQRLLDGDSAIGVVVEYGALGNLEPARANTSLTLSSSQGTDLDLRLFLGVAGLFALAVVGVFVWQFRYDGEPEQDSRPTDDVSIKTTVTNDRTPDELLDEATAALDAERFDAAAVTAYAAVRTRLNDDVTDSQTPMTHWEFHRACRDSDLSEEQLRRFERLTQAYEHAAFAAESVPEDEAAEIVEIASSLRAMATDRNEDRSPSEESDAPSGA